MVNDVYKRFEHDTGWHSGKSHRTRWTPTCTCYIEMTEKLRIGGPAACTYEYPDAHP